MHFSIFSSLNLSHNPTFFSSSDHACSCFRPHHCSPKRLCNSNSGNGFSNSLKMVSESLCFSKNHSDLDGFYRRVSLGLPRECHAKRPSNSNSEIGFCSSHRMVSASNCFTRIHCKVDGFCLGSSGELAKGFCITGASTSKSESGFCISNESAFRSPSFRKNYSNASGFCVSCFPKSNVRCRSCNGLSKNPLVLKVDSNLNGFYIGKYDCLEEHTPKSDFGNWFFSSRTRISKSLTVCRNHGGGIIHEGVGEREHSYYMRRCVEIARNALGCTSPNPMVGCVIVKDGAIVGEGFHPKAGQPHAEVFALRDAGTLAENATAYVSLEPCNHHGRTPPCTEALIRAKVKRVVVGMVDPNPIVASKGVHQLRESGIEVMVGVEEELCRKLNEAYIYRMLTGKPFVTLRYSISFSGQIINKLGKGAEEPGGYYSQLLQEYNGVIMSSTLLAETATVPASQEVGANQPLRIIVAKASNSPLFLPALTTESSTPAIVFVDDNLVMDPTTDQNLGRLGIETVVMERMDLSTIIDYCGSRGLCSILLDLRGDFSDFDEILEIGSKEGLLQKVVMEVCPVWGGSEESSSVLALKSLERKSMSLKDLQAWISKGSVVVEGYI